MDKKNRIKQIPFMLIGFSIILHILAWNAVGFSDWYRSNLFIYIQWGYGKLTSQFPFSIGEIMLLVGAFLVFVWIISTILEIRKLFRKADKTNKKKSNKFKVYQHFNRFLLWIFAIIFLIMELNCFIFYQNSTLKVIPKEKNTLYKTTETNMEFNKIEKLIILRDYLVQEANDYSEKFERDENGYISYNLSFQEISEMAKTEMENLGDTYFSLKGFYPNPKELFFSNFISQQYILGYYFPFSLEANINKNIYPTNLPVTLCHELAHTKGYLLENEANFLSFLACTNSDNDFFVYSGILSVLTYVDSDFKKSIGNDQKIYKDHILISDLVSSDNIFLTKEMWTKVEKESFLSTKFVNKASNFFLESTLNLNGVQDGMISYRRVVEQLLEYYDGYLY